MNGIAAYFYILTCLSGPTCPKTDIPSDQPFYSLQECEEHARLTAQGMFAYSANKYGYRCKLVDYEPPNLGNDHR